MEFQKRENALFSWTVTMLLLDGVDLRGVPAAAAGLARHAARGAGVAAQLALVAATFFFCR